MFKWLSNKLTKNYNNVPLFWVKFNLNKYQQNKIIVGQILSKIHLKEYSISSGVFVNGIRSKSVV